MKPIKLFLRRSLLLSLFFVNWSPAFAQDQKPLIQYDQGFVVGMKLGFDAFLEREYVTQKRPEFLTEVGSNRRKILEWSLPQSIVLVRSPKLQKVLLELLEVVQLKRLNWIEVLQQGQTRMEAALDEMKLGTSKLQGTDSFVLGVVDGVHLFLSQLELSSEDALSGNPVLIGKDARVLFDVVAAILAKLSDGLRAKVEGVKFQGALKKNPQRRALLTLANRLKEVTNLKNAPHPAVESGWLRVLVLQSHDLAQLSDEITSRPDSCSGLFD